MQLKLYAGGEEPVQYDAEIGALAGAGIYQAKSWSEVRAGTHQACWVVVRRDGVAVLSAQILVRRLRGGYAILTAPRGPVGDLHDLSAAAALVGAVRELAATSGALALLADPCRDSADRSVQNLLALGFRRRRLPPTLFGGNLPRRVWRVPLGPLPGEARGRLAPETRRICSRADRLGLRVRSGRADDWPRFKVWLRAHALARGYALPTEDFLDRLLHIWMRHGQARLHVCEQAGRPLAAALTSEFAGEVLGHFSADSPEGRSLGAARRLHLGIIEDAEERGLRVYDMGGIAWDEQRHPQAAGLRRFKSGFGGAAETYAGELELVLRPRAYAAIGAATRLTGRRMSW